MPAHDEARDVCGERIGKGFQQQSAQWGLVHASFSTGAAYADLDLDGDLDILINNLNDPVFLYENKLADKTQPGNSTLRIKLKGAPQNSNAYGATIRVFIKQGQQLFYEHQPVRGYLSSVEPIAHFAISRAMKIDSLQIHWPDGTVFSTTDIPLNKTITSKARKMLIYRVTRNGQHTR